jgi:glycosyltransferase involved in cell wall biosynthesis
MRVLVIAQYFPPDMGGGATRAYNVAKGLGLNGCEVTVVTAFPHYPSGNVPERYRWKPFVLEDVEGFRGVRTFVPPVASQGLVKRLALFLSFIASSLFATPFVGKVDVVWAANPNVLSIFPASFYGFVKRKPVALNVDDLWPEDLHNFGMVDEDSLVFKVMHFVAKFAYLKAGLITPISLGYVEVLCGKYSVNRERVYVVRAGVDLDTFSVVGDRLNCSGEAFRVLYSGAFSVASSSLSIAGQTIKGVMSNFFKVCLGRPMLGHDIMIEKFVKSIINEQTVPVAPEEGRETVRVMEMISNRLV